MIPVDAVVVIFDNIRTTDDDEGYATMSQRMLELAAAQDGFLGVSSVRDPLTRHGITVSYWRDDAAAKAWKQVAEHLQAQSLGRERWYAEYETIVATVTRTYSFAKDV